MAPVESTESVRREVMALVTGQQLAVLSTDGRGQPWASLLAFAGTADLRHLVFATPRTTRKFTNLSENPRVALLINSGTNTEADIHRAASVTAIGTAEVLAPGAEGALLDLYLEKHPHLKTFALAPTTALVRVADQRYTLVRRFQNVTELEPGP